MWPAIIAAAGQAASAGGAIADTLINANQAGISRDDQRYYTEHAHQVETKDLRAAGLNPILSATHGGASNPSPTTMSPSTAGAGVGNAAASLASIPKMLLDIAKAEADVEGAQIQNMNLIKDGVSKDLSNTLSLGMTQKLNIDKEYWGPTAAAELKAKLLGLDLTKASTEAGSASARSYDAGAAKAVQETKLLKGGMGLKNPILHDAAQIAEQVTERVKKMLGGEPHMPVGNHSAKPKRSMPRNPVGD
ncbi:MAG: DNA pilot protein [Arizlama microvirus]|nr:MAG: DNA pilot protein [Arizlama microvirus]